MSPNIYGIGNPLIDIIVHTDDKLLSELGIHKGTMHLIDSTERKEILDSIAQLSCSYSCGGSCPNTMITLSTLGIPAALGGKVGQDEYGLIYKKALKKSGTIDLLSASPESPTGTSIILVTPDSERTMNTFLGANRLFCTSDIDFEALNSSNLFHFTGYMWDTVNQKEAVQSCLNEARDKGKTISFDIADPFAVSRNRETFLSIIGDYADIVFANNEEARILFDNYDAYECCKSMGKICKTAIVKNGKHGSVISHDGRLLRIPAKGTTVIDTTGAGDIYAAGFLYGYLTEEPVTASGHIASYLAGEIISKVGAQFTDEQIRLIKKRLKTTKAQDL